MARGLWKGAISFGLVNVPVELFSAQKRSAEIDLTMLDKRDMAPVGYQRVNKSTGKEVPWEDVVKGYEYADDKYVVLSEEDFRRRSTSSPSLTSRTSRRSTSTRPITLRPASAARRPMRCCAMQWPRPARPASRPSSSARSNTLRR